jgi:hypothetical protein
MFRLRVPVTLVIIALWAGTARAGDTWTTPHPGVQHLFKTTGLPLHIHGLVIDLCAPGTGVRATAPGEKKRTTSSFGKLVGAQAAINGDFYSSGHNVIGYAMGDGQHWPGTADSGWQSLVAFGRGHAHFSDTPEIFSQQWWTTEAVSGFAQIVKDGSAIDSYDCSGHFCERHPRSAVGLSKDRRTLYMMVIDGRTSISIGVTLKELALFMKELGAYDAVNLDGGGSSAIWTAAEGILNNPSDGTERVVANHLAAFASGSGQPGVCNEWPTEQVMIDSALYDSAASTDVDGDGWGDFCARAASGLRCRLTGDNSLAAGVTGPDPELSNDNGWNHPSHFGTIHMGDINGDALADVCARGNGGMRCWLSIGDGFNADTIVGPEWSDGNGWEAEKYYATIRMLDMNGDGMADLCGRGPGGIQCYLANGEGFDDGLPGPELSDANGWGSPQYYATIRSGDITGDGMDDLCARGAAGFMCWPSTGDGFGEQIGGPTWNDAGGWGEMRHWATIRLADITGDGLMDLCARGPGGIECFPSTGEGFGEVVPGPTLTNDTGWHDQTNYLPLRWGDINGDGLTDVCARADAGMLCWLSFGDSFGKAMDGPAMSDGNGWFQAKYYNAIRLTDVDGDGKADLCARKPEGLKCWLSDGSGFPESWIGPEWSDASGWGALQHWAATRLATPRNVSPCLYPGACSPGASESQECGECGAATRYCDENCEWSDWTSCWSDGEHDGICEDENPCTEDLCGTDGDCEHQFNTAPCEDNNPCTQSTCEQGNCVATGTTEQCCMNHNDCDSPLERCDLDFLICLPVLCAPCTTHEDCGAAGNLCLTLEKGTVCGVACGENPDVCPEGFDCLAFGTMPPQCVPADGSCECAPQVETKCKGSKLYWFDGCGQPDDVADDCAGRGCVDGACCPAGSTASNGECSGALWDDLVAEGDVSYGDGVGDDGGSSCTVTANSDRGTGALPILLLLISLLALLRYRGVTPLLGIMLLALFAACGGTGDGTSDSTVKFEYIGQGDGGPLGKEVHCAEGFGCLGAPCESATDCPVGWCIDHLGEKVCSVPCDGDCPEGWICATVVPGTPAEMAICLSLHPTLCKSCVSSYDCIRTDGLKGYCLSFPDETNACGASCSATDPCPDGYLCGPATSVEGEALDQCLPMGGICGAEPRQPPEGDCEITNSWGSCPGLFKVTDSGESICIGPTPMDELCNNLDDDCDGQVDEDNCSICGEPDGCEPNTTAEDLLECGPCSSQVRTRTCDGFCRWSEWSPWSECTEPGGSGDCLPDDSEDESQACGNCGTQVRYRNCTDECSWAEWGDWGDCTQQGECKPGQQDNQSEGCGNCGTRSRKRTCTEGCQWGAWGDWGTCGSQGTCAPGLTTDGGCDKCAQKSCNASCQWENCALKPGSECEWQDGKNWKCCGSGKWHFCLPSTCKWSPSCSTCTGCGC